MGNYKKVGRIGLLLLVVVSFGSVLVAEPHKGDGFSISKESEEYIRVFASLRESAGVPQYFVWKSESGMTSEALSLKRLWQGVSLSLIAKKGKVLFLGDIGVDAHVISDDVYFYTQENECKSKVVKVYEYDDSAGDGQLASRTYEVDLGEESPCRGKNALVSFVHKKKTVVKRLFVQVKINEKEVKRVLKKTSNELIGLEGLEPKLSKVESLEGDAFYIALYQIPNLFVNNQYKVVFRYNKEGFEVIYVGHVGVTRSDYNSEYWQSEKRTDYYSGDGWSEESISDVMTDLNDNGFPEVIRTFSGCCSGQVKLVELKTNVVVKLWESYSN